MEKPTAILGNAVQKTLVLLKRHRSTIWGEDALQKAFWRTISRTYHSFLVHWLSITLFLRKTNQESTSLDRKSYLDRSRATLCTRGEFGRVTYWLQILRSWRRWTDQKSTRKDSMRKRWYFQRRIIYFSNRRWTNQSPWTRSRPENIHLDTAATKSRRKSLWFCWRSRRVSLFHHLTTRFRMPVKQ